MHESWQTILARAQESIAVWTQHAPAFTVGELTLAAHQADAAMLEPAGQAVVTQEDAVDSARNARDTTMDFLKDLSIRAPRKMDGDFSAGDPFHADLKHIRAVEMTGLDTILTRGQRVLSLWEKLNTRNAAMVPPRPAFTVGGVAVATFAASLASLPTKTQAVETVGSVLSDVRNDLLVLKERVHNNNIRWYAAWQGEWAEGSPELNALSQVDTNSGPTPMPTVLEFAPPLTVVNATTVQVNYAAGGGDHASSLMLQWYVTGEPEWSHEVAVELPSQQVSHPSFEQATAHFRTKAHNLTADVYSPPEDVSL